MEPVEHALWLLKRQTELEAQLGKPGGIRITEERELFAVRARLQQYPEAVKAILTAASTLHRPVDTLSPDDVLRTA